MNRTGDERVARRRALVGDSQNNEERSDDLFVATIRQPSRKVAARRWGKVKWYEPASRQGLVETFLKRDSW